jgi:hypothetical protein
MKLFSVCFGDKYWIGMKVFAHSLSHNGKVDGLDWIILTENGSLPDGGEQWIRDCGFHPVVLPATSIGKDRWPSRFPETPSRFKDNWHKLRILLLPQDEYMMLDVDMLCMGDARGIADMRHISASHDAPHKEKPKGHNMGVVRINSDPGLFDECVEVMGITRECPLAEQTILNKVFGRHKGLVETLDYRWNMYAKLAFWVPEMWKPEEAIFVHYIGLHSYKPWVCQLESTRWSGAIEHWQEYRERYGI